MPAKYQKIGPFDQRKRSYRCEACTRSHLKCSGGKCCRYCARRLLPCKYPPATVPPIQFVECTITPANTSDLVGSTLSAALLDDGSSVIRTFFEKFLYKNCITGRDDDFKHVKTNLHSSDMLYHVAYAIGCLHAVSNGKTSGWDSHIQALQAYRSSCSKLSLDMKSESSHDLLTMIEASLLMSFFELTWSGSATGWRRHYHYGTREFFKKLGPEFCSTGPGKTLLLRLRIFELMSSILFASRSFLATKPWLDAMQTIWQHEERSLKDEILDLATICLDHCLLSAEFVFSLSETLTATDCVRMRTLAGQAIHLQSLLDQWKASATEKFQTFPPGDEFVAWSVYYTISIYVHTSFTLNPHWIEHDIATPRLSDEMVSAHVEALLELVTRALTSSTVCPFIFLLPLYVAGNGTTSLHQRQQIGGLLKAINQSYCVTLRSDRQNLSFWTPDDALEAQDRGNLLLQHRRKLFLQALKSDLP